MSTFQHAGGAATPGQAPAQTAYRLSRASDGKTRVDSGNMSVISLPAAQKTIVLDHLKKQALITPSAPPQPQIPQMPQMPQMPALPGLPGAPPPPAVHVQDLGKSFLQGQEVEGKRYIIQPPAQPAPPQMPGMPKLPQVPGMPKPPAAGMPQLPGMPKPPLPAMPQTPTVAEVWSSSQLKLPMATRVNGSFGQQTAICQRAIPGEPHPAAFQIPADYKQILPPPPKLPGR